jgi:hypothetical protein
MAKSKEELEREIDRLLEQNKMTSSSSIPYGDNTDKFYESIKTKNKQELDNQTRLRELQAQASRLKGNPESFAQYKRTVEQIDTLQARVSLDAVYRDERARTSFTEATKKAFSTEAIASDAAKFGRGAGQGEVHQLARQYATSQLRQRLGEASVGVTQWGEHAQSIASEYSGAPDQKKEYMQMMSYRQQDIGRISLLDQAMRAQKRMGIDIGSREESLEKFSSGSFARDNMSREISRDIATGKTGSINQEMKKLEEAAAKVTKALEAMSKTTDRSDENLEKLATSAEEARSEYERQKETVGQMRSGGGGGGINRTANYLNALGTGISAISAGVQGVFVDNAMAITQNRIGQVNFANSRDTDIQAMGKGDMAAYRRVMTDQYAKSVRAGNDMRNTTRMTEAGGTIGDTLLTVGAGLAGGAAGLAVGGPLGAAAGATLSAGWASSALAQRGHGLFNDIKADAVGLAKAQQEVELSNAVNAISDRANQTGMDYRLSNTYNTRGMSQENRNITMPLMEQQSTIDALKGLNMGDKAALLNYGVQAMGDRFGGQRGLNMMVQGNDMARAGGIVNRAEDFIGMAAGLKGASGDENTMMRGIKVAFQEGMKGADVFKNLADSIAGLGNATAALGQKLSEGFASRFASSSAEYTKMGYDAIQANAMAVKGSNEFNAANTNMDLSFGNVDKFQSSYKIFGVQNDSMKRAAAVKAMHMTDKQEEEMNDAIKAYESSSEGSSDRAAKEAKLKQVQHNIGVDLLAQDMQGGVFTSDKMKEIKKARLKALVIEKAGYIEPKNFKKIMDDIETGNLSGDTGSYLNSIDSKSVFVAATKDGSAKGSLDTSLSGRTKTSEQTIEYMKGFENKQGVYGLNNMDPETMKENFLKTLNKYDGGKAYSDQAKEVAETGQLPTEQFVEAVERLNTILENYNKAARENITVEREAVDVFAEAAKSFNDRSAFNPLGSNSQTGWKK